MPYTKEPAPAPHLVFDGRYIQDRYHGIGRYAFHLVRELAALLPEARIDVLRGRHLPESRFDWSELVRSGNVHLKVIEAPPFSAGEQLAIPGLLARHRTALYHTPYFALPWLLPTPAVATVHDCIFERDPRYMPRRWARPYYRLLMHASLRRSRVVFVPSRATADEVKHYYRVPAHKLVVTPEAADGHFRPIEDLRALEETRERYGLPEEFVLAVGARRPHKNFARLVRAVTHVEGLELVFIGEADERFPDLAAEAARAVPDKVRFLGKVPEDDLPLLYNLATMVACPSLVEGFGLPVLEAMACGTPVVCSDIAALREVAGGAGLLVRPDDTQAWTSTLACLASDPERRSKLRLAGLQRAAQFNWRRAAEAVLAAYRRIGTIGAVE